APAPLPDPHVPPRRPRAAPTATDQYEEGMRDHDDPETIRIAERKGSPHGGDSSCDALDGRPVVDSP
ncbi:hypothetical protein ACFV1Y_26345, partial [Streptomyces werraensis]